MGESAFERYVREARRLHVLSREEERECIKKIKRGNKEVKEQFIRLKINSVIKVAKLYKGRGVEQDDLVVEGIIGLLRALDNYDLRKGVRFLSYAVWWMRHYMLKLIYGQSKAVRIPVKQQLNRIAIRDMEAKLSQVFGRLPTTDEIAKELGISTGEIFDAMELAQTAISLDAPFWDKISLMDVVPMGKESLEDSAIRSIYIGEIREKMWKLSQIERTIIRLRFGLTGGTSHTLQQIGDMLNLSRERIRQIEKRALKKLRFVVKE